MWVVRKSLNVNELLSLGLVFHLLPVLSEFSSREDWHELFATLFTEQLNCVERTFNFNYYQTWPSIEDDKTENAVIWLRKLTCWPKLNSKTNQPRKPISVIATLSGELISSDQEWCRWVSALLRFPGGCGDSWGWNFNASTTSCGGCGETFGPSLNFQAGVARSSSPCFLSPLRWGLLLKWLDLPPSLLSTICMCLLTNERRRRTPETARTSHTC